MRGYCGKESCDMINAFLMMGQSNMSGRGALDELPPLESRHVLAFRDGEWEVAVEPVVRDRPFSGEGMGTSFGTTLHALTGADIGLIPCSLGGSPLDMWLPGQELYETALQSAISAMQSGARIAGVLWHQGEADSEHACGAHSYMQRFEPMLERLRAQLYDAARDMGAPERVMQPLPAIVGELGAYLDDFPTSRFHEVINAQLHALAARDERCECVVTSDLEHKGDTLHFSARSQRMMGVRYACAWMSAAKRLGIAI